MTTSHLHVPKGPNLYFLSRGLVILLLFCLFVYAATWLIGGDSHLDTLGGSYGLVAIVFGLIAAATVANATKPTQE